jgi:hypothetical protein
MSFSEEEKRAWHKAKREREWQPPISAGAAPVTECIHCGQPFGFGEGFISDEVSLCDVCNGD